MILTGPEIERRISEGQIKVDPFDVNAVQSNSLDVRLADRLLVYPLWGTSVSPLDTPVMTPYRYLDMKRSNPTRELAIPDAGLILEPGVLYLGSTVERVTTPPDLVPMIDGRSSVGRLGMSVHVTAGRGDCGYSGTWTLELTVIHPLKVYAGVRIAQIWWLKAEGLPRPYAGKYGGAGGPVPSRLWRDFQGEGKADG